MRPAFRSCMLSPAIAAAHATVAPIKMAAAGPTKLCVPSSTTSSREEVRIVAIVTPEMGLLEEPTSPAMYAATAAKRNPAINITAAMRRLTPMLLVKKTNNTRSGITETARAMPTHCIGVSRSVRSTAPALPARARR